METKGILQTVGTVTSLLLGAVSIAVTQYIHDLEKVSAPVDLLHISLIITTIVIMFFTGFSYYNSRIEHDGIHYFLYACVGASLIVLAPSAVIIAGMKIEFGQYWWAVLIGIICLLILGNQKKDARN